MTVTEKIFISGDGIIFLGRSSCTCETVLLFLFITALQHLCFKLKFPNTSVVKHAVTFIDSMPQFSQFKAHSQSQKGCSVSQTWSCLLLLQFVEVLPRWGAGWFSDVWVSTLLPCSECFVRQTGWFHRLWVSVFTLSLWMSFLMRIRLDFLFGKTPIHKFTVWFREAPNNFNAYLETFFFLNSRDTEWR